MKFDDLLIALFCAPRLNRYIFKDNSSLLVSFTYKNQILFNLNKHIINWQMLGHLSAAEVISHEQMLQGSNFFKHDKFIGNIDYNDDKN